MADSKEPDDREDVHRDERVRTRAIVDVRGYRGSICRGVSK